MAINSASGFEIGSSDAIDSRFFLTKAQMKNANENVLPDVYFCVCSTDGNFYVYNKNNAVDEHTGKYRPADALSRGLPNGVASLDENGKLPASQLPTSAREIVGYMDASVDHTLPDETDYDNGNEIIITTSGYIIQSTAFTLEAGKTLTNLEVNQANQLIGYGYVFTLEGKGTVSSFATDKVTMLDGTEISLPYDSDLSATSTPATVQVPVKEGDSIMLIDGHWIHLSSTSGVESVNGKTGVVTVQEYDADNKEQLAKIGENAEGNLTYNGEEIKGGSDEFVGTKAEWEALSTEEKAQYDGKKVNITDDIQTNNCCVIAFGSTTNGFFRKWNNGIMEQWGVSNGENSWGIKTVTLPLEYIDDTYSIILSNYTASASDFTSTSTSTGRGQSRNAYTAKTKSSFGVQKYCEISWYTIGNWK